jgi:hypothetical protein
MCAACVAQGIGYVGASLGGIQVMAARAKAKRPRLRPKATPPIEDENEPALT